MAKKNIKYIEKYLNAAHTYIKNIKLLIDNTEQTELTTIKKGYWGNNKRREFVRMIKTNKSEIENYISKMTIICTTQLAKIQTSKTYDYDQFLILQRLYESLRLSIDKSFKIKDGIAAGVKEWWKNKDSTNSENQGNSQASTQDQTEQTDTGQTNNETGNTKTNTDDTQQEQTQTDTNGTTRNNNNNNEALRAKLKSYQEKLSKLQFDYHKNPEISEMLNQQKQDIINYSSNEAEPLTKRANIIIATFIIFDSYNTYLKSHKGYADLVYIENINLYIEDIIKKNNGLLQEKIFRSHVGQHLENIRQNIINIYTQKLNDLKSLNFNNNMLSNKFKLAIETAIEIAKKDKELEYGNIIANYHLLLSLKDIISMNQNKYDTQLAGQKFNLKALRTQYSTYVNNIQRMNESIEFVTQRIITTFLEACKAQKTSNQETDNQQNNTNQETSDQQNNTNQETSDQQTNTNQETSDQQNNTNQETSDQQNNTNQETSDQQTNTNQETSDQQNNTNQENQNNPQPEDSSLIVFDPTKINEEKNEKSFFGGYKKDKSQENNDPNLENKINDFKQRIMGINFEQDKMPENALKLFNKLKMKVILGSVDQYKSQKMRFEVIKISYSVLQIFKDYVDENYNGYVLEFMKRDLFKPTNNPLKNIIDNFIIEIEGDPSKYNVQTLRSYVIQKLNQYKWKKATQNNSASSDN